MSIGFEVGFGLDNFQNPKILTDKESIAQIILNLLFLKPGNLPNFPHMGINIQQYLYKFESQIDSDAIKEKIYNQCSAILPYITLGEVKIFVATYKEKPILLLVIPIETNTIIYGFQKDTTGGLIFNYDFETNVITQN